MKKWITIVKAISPQTGELTTYDGPYVQGDTEEEAQMFCLRNGLNYCHIDGMLVAEIPCKADSSPDWENAVWYDVDNAADQVVRNGAVFHQIRFIK